MPMASDTLTVARTVARSAANGPYTRFVVWVQGCPLACPGCINPDTWDPRAGRRTTVDALWHAIEGIADGIPGTTDGTNDGAHDGTEGIDGITLTGGEPFEQAGPLARLAARAHRRGLGVVAYTGYPLAALTTPAHRALLAEVDLLIAGPYVARQRTTRLPWRGSRNQRLHHLTARYRDVDPGEAIEAEIILDGGARVLTGVPTPELLRIIQQRDT